MAHEQTDATILVREGTYPRHHWKQFLVISDERVVIVDMTPAMWGGWNIGRVTVQGPHDWPGMSRDAIVAWKWRNDDGRTSMATLDATFEAKLLERARTA